MVAYNKKQRNKRKIPAVLPATVGTIAGVGGTAALTKAYLLRQQEYANNEKSKGIFDKNAEGTNAGKYVGDTNGDGVYTKEEYDAAVNNHYYKGDQLKSGFDQEYVNSMADQVKNDPNFFTTQKLYDNNNTDLKNKLTAALTAANNKIDGNDNDIAPTDFENFLAQKVGNKKLTSEQLGKELKTYLQGIKASTAKDAPQKYTDENIDKVVKEVTGTKEAFVDTQVVNTEYADNAAAYEKMSNNATKQNFSFRSSLESAREVAATKIGNNSLICKEIAKATGADVFDVAGKVIDTTATVGVAAIAGLSAIAANKLVKKVGNYFERKKEERAEKKEQKVAEMKRSLSQARAANAMRVQMAGDFENTASNGRFNNRG